MPPIHGESYWNATAAPAAFPPLAAETDVDVAIVGGGIVGVTAARLLKDRGLTVAIAEAQRVGRGVTGRSTAKVTSQHGLRYQVLARKFGDEGARLYAEAQEWGVRKISELCAEHAIDADLESRPAFVWTADEACVGQIEKEVETARNLGLPASFTRDTGLPFGVAGAIRFDDQAQFHPTRYVAGLAATIPGAGSLIFENSRVVDWDPTRVLTDHGAISARHVILATHLPLGQVGGFYAEAAPYAEPVIAARMGRALGGMFLNVEDPHYSIRTHTGADGAVYAVAAGGRFKPGHVDEERARLSEIECWVAEMFGAAQPEYRWVNEDYMSIDEAPFIGWSGSGVGHYLVATGFGAWGISNGTAAAAILADLVTGKENRWLDVFDATRVKPVAGGARFLKENLGVAGHLAGGHLSRKRHSFEELEPGDAAIMKIDGDHIAAFRDETGALHWVSAVCSHMGCLVGWNETDRTWDCPCHGSRFGLDGAVLHGPATRPLGSPITG